MDAVESWFLLEGTLWEFDYVTGETSQLISHCEGLCLLPGQSMWNLWQTKWHWVRFFSEPFIFPLSVSFHCCSIFLHTVWGWTLGLWMATDLQTQFHLIVTIRKDCETWHMEWLVLKNDEYFHCKKTQWDRFSVHFWTLQSSWSQP